MSTTSDKSPVLVVGGGIGGLSTKRAVVHAATLGVRGGCTSMSKLTPHPRRICWPIDKTLLRLPPLPSWVGLVVCASGRTRLSQGFQ